MPVLRQSIQLSHLFRDPTSRLNRPFHYFSDVCLPDPPAADGLLLDVLWFVNILPHRGSPKLTDNILDSLTTAEGYYLSHSGYYTTGSSTKTQKVIFPKKCCEVKHTPFGTCAKLRTRICICPSSLLSPSLTFWALIMSANSMGSHTSFIFLSSVMYLNLHTLVLRHIFQGSLSKGGWTNEWMK